MYTRWPKIGNASKRPSTEFKHLTVKSTLYALHTPGWGPNFGPFYSTTSRFQDTRLSEIWNATNDTKLNMNILTIKKYSIYPIHTYPRDPYFHFALRPAISKISHFLLFPIDLTDSTMLNAPPQKKKKKRTKEICQKFKISNVTIV